MSKLAVANKLKSTSPKTHEATNRYLFLGYNPAGHDSVVHDLKNRGNEVKTLTEITTALGNLGKYKPDVIVLRAYFPKAVFRNILESVSELAAKHKAILVVMSPKVTEEDIRFMVKMGVSDFVLIPCEPRILVRRLEYQLSKRNTIRTEELVERSRELSVSLKLISDILRVNSKIEDAHDRLHEALKAIADFSDSPRVNLFVGRPHLDQGAIIASSDSKEVRRYFTRLTKYPEVREVLLKGLIVHVKDVSKNRLTLALLDNAKSIQVDSIVVLPIKYRNKIIGALHIRLQKAQTPLGKKFLNTFYNAGLSLAPALIEYVSQIPDFKELAR